MAQNSVLSKVEEARKWCEVVKDAKERLEVALVPEREIGDDTKTAMKEASKFEAKYVTEVCCRRDEVGDPPSQSCQQTAFAAAGKKE